MINPQQFFSSPQNMIQTLKNSGNPIGFMENMLKMTGNPNMIQAFNQAKNMVKNNSRESMPQVAQNVAKTNNLNYNEFAQTAQQWGMPLTSVDNNTENNK